MISVSPNTNTAFAEWVATYASELGLPECKPSLLYKADGIYLKPLYRWEEGADGKDRVRKEHDHAMDDMRYFVSTVLKQAQSGFSVGSVARRR